MLRSTQHSRIVRCLIFVACALAAAAAPRAATAQSCQWSPDLTPASPAPSALWNGLEPTETTIPSCQTQGCASRDTSWFNTNGGYGLHNPYFESFDIEQGTLFAATNLALQIWNLNTPATPTRISQTDIRFLAPDLNFQPHDYFIPTDLDAPDGNDNMVAMTGRNSMGMLMVSSTGPSAIYQDSGPGSGQKVGNEVYAGRINNRDYAFLAVQGGPSYSGVWAYDMTAAAALPNRPCVETRPTQVNPACNGVYKSQLSTEDVGHIDGAGNFVVFSGGKASFTFKGFEIWNVANPGSPFQVHSGLVNDRVDGVALWQQGAKYYLALHNRDSLQGQIYDVTCIATNSCGGLSLKYSFPLVGFSNFATLGTVTDSVSNGTTFVHFGSRLMNSLTGLQEEWLFDTTPLASNQDPIEITGGDPQNGNQGQPTIVVDGKTVGYWSYYYMCNPTGTNLYRPNMGKFDGSYFYRAGNSIFDVHRRRSVSPVINVSGPTTGFVGQNLQFTAQALNCTASSNGWSWSTTGGTGTSTTSSISVSWSTSGTKSVTASNSSCPGAAQNPAAISIASAAPSVGSVTRTPATATVCTPITFTANNVNGLPPLTLGWEVLQSGTPIASPACPATTPGETFCWDTTAASPGSYQGRVTVSGPGGPDAAATSAAVTLTALPALPSPGFPITNDAFIAGTVQFHSAVAGATEWRWDFDDGTILETTDPVLGPNPAHTYSAIGNYDVTLQVRNCQNLTYVSSQVLPIEILQITPLEIVTFQAVCPFGQCSFNVGGAITFNTVVTGDPDFYEYDWNGTGQFASSATPVTSHAYLGVGTYSPVLRLRRGAETVTKIHVPPIQVTTGTPPPTPTISVSGPSTATVGQSRTYTASASNCTPSANGWAWTTTGGTGTSTTSSISVSWASAGTKVVRATNSACGTASGSRTVSVTGGQQPPPGGTFAAAFNFSPSAPEAGQQVSFDASPSTGNPTTWTWAFGDGSTATGQQVTHAYSQPGNYSAQLTVTKVEAGCGSFGQNICSDTATETVEVTGSTSVCVPNNETLCLQSGRFQVNARWRDHRTGSQGNAKVYTPFNSDKTGMFWFFRPDNVELIVKTLDGTTVNGNYWFFYGGLSDVEYWITVVDTETEASNEYHNEPGSICGFPDTGAFPGSGGTEELTSGAWSAAPLPAAAGGVESMSAAMGTCTSNGNNLCLLGNRFSLEVDWHDQRSGDTGLGRPVVGTDRTGYFWFFNAQNIELVAKMIDATDPFGYFWVLWGGLSDVEYTLTVTDTVSGLDQEYHNPPGSFCGGADTGAFESE